MLVYVGADVLNGFCFERNDLLKNFMSNNKEFKYK
jgi:hypothetical protein